MVSPVWERTCNQFYSKWLYATCCFLDWHTWNQSDCADYAPNVHIYNHNIIYTMKRLINAATSTSVLAALVLLSDIIVGLLIYKI